MKAAVRLFSTMVTNLFVAIMPMSVQWMMSNLRNLKQKPPKNLQNRYRMTQESVEEEGVSKDSMEPVDKESKVCPRNSPRTRGWRSSHLRNFPGQTRNPKKGSNGTRKNKPLIGRGGLKSLLSVIKEDANGTESKDYANSAWDK